ncbi:universal stress protein [Halobacteriales archaeon QH_10_67_22]|nr:MAG: universal stress protein [Halobacteriales archaeon QH_10_67_22]
MTEVVVPVRYPLTDHSKRTLAKAIDIATERDGQLTVLHVNQFQTNGSVTRAQLKSAVEREFGRLSNVRYLVRKGMFIEETLLDEVVAADADVVVIGKKQASRWRRMIRRLVDNPDIEHYLRTELDCDVVTAEP